MPTIRLADLLHPAEVVHFAAPRISVATPAGLHDHDFAEIFWVEAGEGTHWLPGGREKLTPGEFRCIRPADRHAFSSGSGGVTLVNIAFRPASWDAVRKQYGVTDLFDPGGEMFGRHLTPAERDELRYAASDLRAGRRDALALDRLLLHVARLAENPAPPPRLPPWLANALEKLADPQWLREGTAGLAHLAGRSPEHVARAVRKYLGKTPTDVLNELRLTYAAERLASTDDKILAIAQDCGLSNLAHFHSVFRTRFGTTPRRYRLRQQAIVRP